MDQLRRLPVSAFGLALLLVALYVVVRTAGLPLVVLQAWALAACLAALASPLAGLTVVAAIGPFTEALGADGTITPMPFLLAALGFALLIHAWLNRPLPRLSVALLSAIALLVATALGVLLSALLYGSGRGIEAFQGWVPGLGGGMTVLLVAAWLAARGELRPLAVVVASITVGALISLVDFASRGAVADSGLGWLIRSGALQDRLQGILAAPNPEAALFLAGASVAIATAAFGRRTDLRVLAALAAAVLVLGAVGTLSRSGMLALLAVGAIIAWHWRRWAGALLLGVAAIAALLLVAGVSIVRDVPQVFDEARLQAWRASVDMWLAAPLTGHGFRSFEWLHAQFGSVLDAPHNEWLRLFAEEGTGGGLVGLLFAVTVSVTLLRHRSWLVVATGAAAVSLFFIACFNNPFLYVQVTAPVFLVIGCGLGLAIGRAARRPPETCAG